LSLHEIIIALMLIAPTWYLGVRGENVIGLLTQIDPVMYHVDHHAELTDIFNGVGDKI